MVNDLPYGPIRPCDLDSFVYFAGKKFGYLRHIQYRCYYPEGRPEEKPMPYDDWPTPWEEYIKYISKKEKQ